MSPYLTCHPGKVGRLSAAAFTHLTWADHLIRRMGIGRLLDELRARQAERASDALIAGWSQAARLCALMEAHIRARMIYPRRTECLPGSAALAVHAWRLGVPVRFVIGVQKYPFYAHAWVELGDTVVNDVQEIHERLAFIVTIPDPTAHPADGERA